MRTKEICSDCGKSECTFYNTTIEDLIICYDCMNNNYCIRCERKNLLIHFINGEKCISSECKCTFGKNFIQTNPFIYNLCQLAPFEGKEEIIILGEEIKEEVKEEIKECKVLICEEVFEKYDFSIFE